MHEERDTLCHFVMSIVKYYESRYAAVLDRYEMVTHPDIDPVQQGLTAVNRREPVFSLW